MQKFMAYMFAALRIGSAPVSVYKCRSLLCGGVGDEGSYDDTASTDTLCFTDGASAKVMEPRQVNGNLVASVADAHSVSVADLYNAFSPKIACIEFADGKVVDAAAAMRFLCRRAGARRATM